MDKCFKELNENPQCVKRLENVANRDRFGRTPLHYAASYGYVVAVMRLLRRGADPNAGDDIGQTPLHLAACVGRFDIATLLLRYGADPNVKTKYDGRTPLHYAAAEGHLAVVAALLKYKAYVDAKDNYGKTPLYLGVQNARIDVVSYLLKKGAKPDVREERGLETPLHVAAYYGDVVAMKLLIKHGADVNARDVFRKTPLHFARSPDAAKLLIKHGADVNARDVYGRTPLDYAMEENTEVVKVLLRLGATADREGGA
jgi:ankyrin repeat protein